MKCQGANVKLTKRLHIDCARFVIARHGFVFGREDSLVEQAFVDEEITPQLIAVAIEQRMV